MTSGNRGGRGRRPGKADVPRRAILALCLPLCAATLACRAGTGAPDAAGVYAEQRCGPRGRWDRQGTEDAEFGVFNRLEITGSGMRWNGAAIDQAVLVTYVEAVKTLDPQPVTALVVHPRAACGQVRTIRRLMEERLRCTAEGGCTEYALGEWLGRHPT